MEKDTLRGLPYDKLMEMYNTIREEIRRRNQETPIHIQEKPYGTTD